MFLTYMYFPLICRNIMVLRWGICGAGLICSDFVSAVLAPPNNGHEVKEKKYIQIVPASRTPVF